METEKPRSECGIFAMHVPGSEVSRDTIRGLANLQHRGHESAGMVVSDGERLNARRGLGRVTQVFPDLDEVASELRGHIALAHNRYATSGSGREENTHPIMRDSDLGSFGLAHNGNLTNTAELRTELRERGLEADGDSDSDLAALCIATMEGDTWTERLSRFMERAEGAYSMVVMTKRELYAFRDPHGFRPFVLGRVDGHGWAVSSETCAYRAIGVSPKRDIAPGELIRIDETGYHTEFHRPDERQAFCVFEHVYLSRGTSSLAERHVSRVRKDIGARLAQEAPVAADLVSGVPLASLPHARGYAHELALHYDDAFERNPDAGRSFISPSGRREIVESKLNPDPDVVEGKRVCLVDDSIIRANTAKALVEMLRDAGATEVHFRIASPPIVDTCHMGVDIARREELVAHRKSVEEVRQVIGANSLEHITLEGMIGAIGTPEDALCHACMSGRYPIEVKDKREPYDLASDER